MGNESLHAASAIGEARFNLVLETLERFPRNLRLPDPLDRIYERRTGFRRARALYSVGYFALLVYNLFLVTDYLMIPDAFRTALIVRVAIMDPLIVAAMYFQYRNPPARWREGVETAVIYLASLSIVFLLTVTNRVLSITYHQGLTLIVIFANLQVRLPFRYALVFSVATLATYLAGMPFYAPGPPLVLLNNTFYLSSAIVLTLITNYVLERHIKRNFLLIYKEQRLASKLYDEKSQLAELSNVDALTGLLNRRYLETFLESHADACGVDEYGVILIDIDFFKKYNDFYGHPAGDDCLRAVATALKGSAVRKDDIVARFGGEEFIAILPGASEKITRLVAERIRSGVRELNIVHGGSARDGVVTVSCGAAFSHARSGISCQDMIQRADDALYRAKGAGRDTVVVDTGAPTTTG